MRFDHTPLVPSASLFLGTVSSQKAAKTVFSCPILSEEGDT